MQSALLFIATLLAGANACARYEKCHCTNADGTPNNTITTTVCNNSNQLAPKSPGWPLYYLDENDVTKCIVNQNPNFFLAPDNCQFRDFCTAAGATGADSSCEINVNQK
ncbi:hypothetical protein LZ30DRAFT_728236 [Colletotrichum cereale]|nr:hypothetical protein LZ30DRAFT_728236 [Colletotrichum cereale]